MPAPPAPLESSHRLNAPIVLTAVAPTGSDEHGRPPPQWMPGQRLTAHVIESDGKGRWRVEVGGRQFLMTLPSWIRGGDSVELSYLHATPRVTFALTPSPAPPAGTSVSLGAAARMIGELARPTTEERTTAAEASASGATSRETGRAAAGSLAATFATAPLLGAGPVAADLLAPLLRRALSRSGLFYESHQLQWITGQRSLESLLAEPQGGLSRPPPAETAPLVRRQLETLETGHLSWQGQVWPGQPMRWEIDEPPADERRERDPSARGWRTRLHLELPALGGVDAELSFADGAVRVELLAADAARATRMRAALPGLLGAFEAAGLPLTAVTVRHALDGAP